MVGIQLLIITGNPGSGKSELAHALEEIIGDGWSFVHGDAYIEVVQRRYGPRNWSLLRPYLAPVSAEGIREAALAGRRVVYDGCVLSMNEVLTLASAIGVAYPHPSVVLAQLSCSEDTVVARRMPIQWDRFGVPTSRAESEVKERVIRSHHRLHTPTGLIGAQTILTDHRSPDEVLRELLRWLASKDDNAKPRDDTPEERAS